MMENVYEFNMVILTSSVSIFFWLYLVHQYKNFGKIGILLVKIIQVMKNLNLFIIMVKHDRIHIPVLLFIVDPKNYLKTV
jgi:hypothetical protein